MQLRAPRATRPATPFPYTTLFRSTAGMALMESLRDAGLGVDGTCGGAMSCGTCHVYVAAAWLDKLPAKSQDEADMIEALADLVELRPGSGLDRKCVG